MSMFSLLKRIYLLVISLFSFLKYARQGLPYYFSRTPDPQAGAQLLYLDLNRNLFRRYLYTFIKMLHLNGYNIYVSRRLLLIMDLLANKYARLLLTDRIIGIGYPKIDDKHSIIIMSKINLSPDYYRFMIDNHIKQSSICIPMCQHPLMYRKGYWDKSVDSVPRKNSLFMAGGLNEKAYAKIEKDAIFRVLSRGSVFKKVKNLIFHLENYESLLDYTNQNSVDNKVILIDTELFTVPMSQLRKVISRFDFFFALPGVVMPFSHNVIEAMSVGCIPFIQNTYAKLFRPPLQNGIHCITYDGAEDMAKQISSLFLLPVSKKMEIRQSVDTYYKEHLTPSAIGELLHAWNRTDVIYLQAEHHSVQLLRLGMDSFENKSAK